MPKSEARAIAGWPAEAVRYRVAGIDVELLSVGNLESLLDRDQLLRDDSLEPPYWALVWSGAVRLADWMCRRDGLRGATVLDVGCGLGLVSLAAAQCGAHVTALDRDPDALAFVAESARRAGHRLECLEGDVEQVLGGRRFDVVVGAELLYERASFRRLANALVDAVAPRGVLYLGDARRVDTRDFYEALDDTGARLLDERYERVDEEGTTVRIRLAAYGAPAAGG